jgi:hypothetical protein
MGGLPFRVGAALSGKISACNLLPENQNPCCDPLCHEKHDRQHMRASCGERPPGARSEKLAGGLRCYEGRSPSRKLRAQGSAQAFEKARFGQGNQRESKGFFVAFHAFSWSNPGEIAKVSSHNAMGSAGACASPPAPAAPPTTECYRASSTGFRASCCAASPAPATGACGSRAA